MDSEKLINSFEIKNLSHLFIYGTIIVFWQFDNNFSALLLWKIYVFNIFKIADFFTLLLYHEVLTF